MNGNTLYENIFLSLCCTIPWKHEQIATHSKQENWLQINEKMPVKYKMVNNEFYWSSLWEYGWAVSYRKKNNWKIALVPKSLPKGWWLMKAWNLEHTAQPEDSLTCWRATFAQLSESLFFFRLVGIGFFQVLCFSKSTFQYSFLYSYIHTCVHIYECTWTHTHTFTWERKRLVNLVSFMNFWSQRVACSLNLMSFITGWNILLPFRIDLITRWKVLFSIRRKLHPGVITLLNSMAEYLR